MQFDNLLTTDIHEAGAEMEIRNPATGEPTGAFLLLKGIDSRTFRAASSEFNRRRLEKDHDIQALALDMSVAITSGWRGIEGREFSKDAVRELYEKSPAIRMQVDEWFQDRRNFTKG